MATDPTDEPAAEVILLVLSGLDKGTDLDDIAPQVAALASERSLFPGDVLIDLAADIIEASGATRAHPIDTTDIRRRLLPEDRAHTKDQHLKADFAIVRAWKADLWGNLVFRKTARNFSPLMCMAAKVTIVEAEHIVPVGELEPDQIHVPSVYVKRVVQSQGLNKWIERRTVRPRPA